MLDQSFPRSIGQLQTVALSLGKLASEVELGSVHLLMTETLRQIVIDFDWSPPREYTLLNDIYALLTQWFLQPHEGLVFLDTNTVAADAPHPVPAGCSCYGLVDIWADELGRVLKMHDACSPRRFFVGIVCESAFSGGPLASYMTDVRAFPLVGPTQIGTLEDAYVIQLEKAYLQQLKNQSVTFEQARKNCGLLGGKLSKPGRGSHYIVKFPGARSWPLDANLDPIPSAYLDQLVAITKLDLLVIKFILINGLRPKPTLRLKGSS